MTTEDRQKLVDSLYRLANFLQDCPDAPAPTVADFYAFVYTKEELAKAVRTIGGDFQKDFSGDYVYVRKDFGAFRLNITIPRNEVCERVVVGTKTVPEHTIAEYEQEIVEWRCSESILGNGGE